MHRLYKAIEKRKPADGEKQSFGYGVTSMDHLEELYGKVLSLSARVLVLEKCRDELTEIIKEQEIEIAYLKRINPIRYAINRLIQFLSKL